MDPWIDEASSLLTDLWPDAPDGETLTTVLEAAQEQCAAYAPKPKLDEAGQPVIPSDWKIALVMQARATWRSLLAGSNDQIGPDGITVTVWPMDRTVKALLRPPHPARRQVR